MQKNYSILVILLIALSSCFGGDDDNKRSAAAAGTEKTVTLQNIELINCDSDLCSVENCTEDNVITNVNSDFRIHGLFVVDYKALVVDNIDNAPSILFNISGLETGSITSVRYQYERVDSQDSVLQKTEYKLLYGNDNAYKIPLHVKNLSGGLLKASPYDKHYISLEITDSDNIKHFASINFSMTSKLESPVIVHRDKERVDNSPYYKFLGADGYLIDTLIIENILPYSIKNDLDISVTNSTLAALQLTEGVQGKIYLGSCITSSVNLKAFKFAATTVSRFIRAEANMAYSVKLFRDLSNPQEEGVLMPVTILDTGVSHTIKLKDLLLAGGEKIRIDVVGKFINTSTAAGYVSSADFYQGLSTCEDINTIASGNCSCFYMYPGLLARINSENSLSCGSDGNVSATVMIGDVFNKNLINMSLPNCGYNVQQSLYASKINAQNLLGRQHKTLTNIKVVSYFDELDDTSSIGSLVSDFDELSAATGSIETDAGNTTTVQTFIEM